MFLSSAATPWTSSEHTAFTQTKGQVFNSPWGGNVMTQENSSSLSTATPHSLTPLGPLTFFFMRLTSFSALNPGQKFRSIKNMSLFSITQLAFWPWASGKTTSHFSGVPGASQVPRCWVVRLEGGVGKRLLLRHVISLDLFPAGPLLLFCRDGNVGVFGRAAFDLIYLDTAVFSLGFSVLNSDHVSVLSTDLFCSWNSWSPIFSSFYSHPWKILSSQEWHKFSFFNVLHSGPPLDFPKSVSFWNKEQNCLKLYLSSPLLHPSLKAVRTEPAAMEKEKRAPQRVKGRVSHIKYYLAIYLICM